MRRRIIMLGVVVAVLVGTGSGAAVGYLRAAQITEPNANGVITACYDTTSGKPRMVNSGARCAGGEKKLTWRQYPARPVVHMVGAPGQLAYASGWSAYNSPPFGNLSYYKDSSGLVHLTGLACNTPVGGGGCGGLLVGGTSPVFTLPAALRPAVQQLFTTLSYGNGDYHHVRVDITPGGVVEVVTPPEAGLSWVSFDGVSFLAG